MLKELKLSKPKANLMNLAISYAKLAKKHGDYPIGAVLYNVKTKEIIAGHNFAKIKDDSTRHAEIELIRYAVDKQVGPYLEDWILYTTHEPCPMCAGAAVWARLRGIVYALPMEEMFKRTDVKEHYKWRTIDIKCAKVIEGKGILLFKNFLYEKAIKLFDR